MTTLLLSAKNGTSLRTVNRLLAHGADRNARDDKGNTLLHCVAMNHKDGNAEERLAWELVNGVDLKAVNPAGQTPLDRARVVGNRAMIEAIGSLESAADGPQRAPRWALPSLSRALWPQTERCPGTQRSCHAYLRVLQHQNPGSCPRTCPRLRKNLWSA